FLKTTILMESNGPTGYMVILQYVELQKSLKMKIQPLSTTDAIYSMLSNMKEKTEEDLNKSLG
ncbi:hypothetical protein DFH28DRAFT_882016, partial [Melampsora americana]